MNWLFWAAEQLWSHYQLEKKARTIEDVKRTAAGAGITLLGFLFGFCALNLLLLSSFFFLLEQPKYSLAVLWIGFVYSAVTFAIWFLGSRYLRRTLKV